MKILTRKDAASRARLTPERAEKARLAVIRAEYNRDIGLSLEKKCVETLIAGGVPTPNIERFVVPGCFEIPLFAQRLAAQKHYHALIALGAVIRGETHHFDLVAGECARGVMQVSLKHNIPIIFEVLATHNRRDALRRAGDNQANKGIEAACAALALLAEIEKLGSL